MRSFKLTSNIAGWLVFAVATIVYYFSAERTGSLWDCGEFILGAFKLQVVHPPGAPLFLLVGRMFAWVATLFSKNPSDIAFAVNLMSGICSAFAAMFIALTTMILGKISLVGQGEEPDAGQNLALFGAGLVSGLATAFCTSIWFSAVEGEVYAMSTFFTALTLWAIVKWYDLPNDPQNDRWLIFAVYMAGLSIGVHLLSILTFPALALFFYFKRYPNTTFLGMALAAVAGVVIIGLVQFFIITGVPGMWAFYEKLMVNSFGLPFHSGLIPTIITIAAVVYFGLRYAKNTGNPTIQNVVMSLALLVISVSTYGVVVTRAIADTPVNMNTPSDAMRLLPYLNREQYGDRPLLRGPNFTGKPIDYKTEDRWGQVGNHYEIVDQQLDYVYDDKDKVMFPRMADGSQGRPQLYQRWMGLDPNAALPVGRPNAFDNLSFFVRYQINWMYWRYFMWNFAGRQNGDQGYYSWDKSSGNWISGIPFIDSRLGNLANMPDTMKNTQARNTYFMLPLLFGLLGLVFHFNRRRNDFIGLLGLFVITGIGIIVYSNQPPNEPRERDYVLAGSFFTFCIWIGFGVIALYDILSTRVKLSGTVGGVLATLIVLSAPLIMGFQNFDDHSRNDHYASRDYASNFLNSCAPNAIIFTYGDNDTYPLWYAQEVENIRRDVRVINLSLIAVDWYINLLRRKINDSPAIKLSISADSYRGSKRNQVMYYNQGGPDRPMSVQEFVRFIGENHPLPLQGGRETESYLPTKQVFIPVDRGKVLKSGLANASDTSLVTAIPLNFTEDMLVKDDIAVLDIIASNIWDRPIYFAVTVQPNQFFGMDDFLQLEGLALRIVPTRGKSDPSFGVIGSGKVNTDLFFNNVIKKFKWGNFDKKKLYVDNSYGPSIQSLQLSIRRAAGAFLEAGDNKKAIAMIDEYFKRFPHMNFPFDYRTYYMLDVYFQAGVYPKAKPIMQILAKETAQYLKFLQDQDPDVIQTSYQTQKELNTRTMEFLLRDAAQYKDEKFLAELNKMFKPYRTTGVENIQQPIPPTQ
jgi:Protein of unknown function (DUF2723)